MSTSKQYAGNHGDATHRSSNRQDRRQFLRRICGGTAVVLGSRRVPGEKSAVAETSVGGRPDPKQMLTIKIGPVTVSRLVAGGNPVKGNSHSTYNLTRHMREYFTPEKTIEYYRRCYEHGINTFQSSPSDKIYATLIAARKQGIPIQWLPIASAGPPHSPISKELLDLNPVAIAHHGRSPSILEVYKYFYWKKVNFEVCPILATSER